MKGYFYHLWMAAAVSCMLTMGTWMTAWAEESKAAEAETGASRVILCGASTEKEKAESSASDSETEASASDSETEASASDSETETGKSGRQGASLGMHITTGYCTCELCCSGSGLTYSGTVPKANHTISADLELYPIGTRLMIDGIIYTVEDMGSSVQDHMIDIYYDNHEDAVAHGMKTQEVFAVED